jgi:hypothetical protein
MILFSLLHTAKMGGVEAMAPGEAAEEPPTMWLASPRSYMKDRSQATTSKDTRGGAFSSGSGISLPRRVFVRLCPSDGTEMGLPLSERRCCNGASCLRRCVTVLPKQHSSKMKLQFIKANTENKSHCLK